MASSDLKVVRILWVDASGQHRVRVVPEKRFEKSVKKIGVTLAKACMGMPSFTDSPAENTNLTAVGEIRLIPDESTLVDIPWTKNEKLALGDMYRTIGERWEYCPRGTLHRLTKVLKAEFNLEMKSGFENEYYLLKKSLRNGQEEWVPFDSTLYCSSISYDASSAYQYEVISSLDALNVPLEQAHAEGGKGQFEVALGYTTATKAAEWQILTREVIRAVARKHGLLATFVPKYKLDDLGSGSHVHTSLWRDGNNVLVDDSTPHGLSDIGEEFMAGVLAHLPSILAFAAPLPNSYDRIQPNMWSGAYQCWGIENREAPVRTALTPDGKVSNFEIKVLDGCTNPYLGLAAILAAGIDGLRRHLKLPEPIDDNPHDRVVPLKRLPESLSKSVEALENDSIMTELLGENLLRAIKGVRRAEIKYYEENKEAYKDLIYRF